MHYQMLLPSVLLALLFALMPPVAQSFTVTPVTNTTQILQTLFNTSCGETPEFKNVSLIGSLPQVGSFAGAESPNTIQLSPFGIVFSSGYAIGAVGPNTEPDYSGSMGTPGDSSISDSYDASGLIATLLWPSLPAGTFSFEMSFVFGSEEYPEYVNNINDAFNLFVDGVNCALVQGEEVSFPFSLFSFSSLYH